jgi:NAD+ kinase
MSKTIALFGGNFNPPGLHHRALAEHLSKNFDEVIVVPCGPRPDKQIINNIDPVYRATMTDIAFRSLKNVRVELFDLEQNSFTRTHALETKFAPEGEIWHVVGSDMVTGGKDGSSRIQRDWERGTELWANSKFVVVTRAGFPLDPKDTPPNAKVLDLNLEGASDVIRERLFRRERVNDLTDNEVLGYIERYGLYRGSLPRRINRHSFAKDLRLLLFYDERNPKAVEWAKRFEHLANPEDPNCVLAIGGDGTMLHAIQQHWRKRIPFFGLNAGHLGFLLNESQSVFDNFPKQDIILRHLPMLYVEMTTQSGEIKSMLSFNDAWVERATGQTAWLEVKINGQTKIEKLVCDGALVSTAAGSTAYARAMGASALLADTPAWLLVGSNVMFPANWKSAMLSVDAEVELNVLNSEKRPVSGFVYGIPMGHIRSMRSRMSRTACVEVGFLNQHDLAEKLAILQFPK